MLASPYQGAYLNGHIVSRSPCGGNLNRAVGAADIVLVHK